MTVRIAAKCLEPIRLCSSRHRDDPPSFNLPTGSADLNSEGGAARPGEGHRKKFTPLVAL